MTVTLYIYIYNITLSCEQGGLELADFLNHVNQLRYTKSLSNIP